ncbi:glycerate kinase [Streptococcus urinalis FB127-CNA-2]|uniref:Glycerate kinase n=1 Tax=Streptococcus urinalis 2285-97 TaxID=764291 RepID=G5KGU0_9STRE|nr:glycerate kinase [Streptococcus urinalis]EHJ56553.1 glycerate kinase [Streptococcus urinalis 2285-97]EKS21002.1 glycerate kinase [Streptococcus urinalis FB127-CNA-2]VEF31011.1 Glycerate kinase [Streptococcus urinalis]
MSIVIAVDSFKGSLSSLDAGLAIKKGILKADTNAEIIVRPIADGGEGTVEALTQDMGGKIITKTVTGPLGQKVSATYGFIEHQKTAIIEMATASGLTLIATEHRNPLLTTTYGLGELIKDAIKKGARHFIIGIGGSATNDGGIGMLQALGFTLVDKNDKAVSRGALGLKELHKIDITTAIPELKECDFSIASDVTNPLTGNNGASRVFGPQKGANPEMILKMDTWLANYAHLVNQDVKLIYSNTPGSGAAGGLGFAFMAFFKTTLESGIDLILRKTNLRTYLEKADIVITGEGKLDSQTSMGKAPIGIAKLAKSFNKPVIAFSGIVTAEANRCHTAGIDAFFPILRDITTLEQALKPEVAKNNLENTSEQVFRLINIFQK